MKFISLVLLGIVSHVWAAEPVLIRTAVQRAVAYDFKKPVQSLEVIDTEHLFRVIKNDHKTTVLYFAGVKTGTGEILVRLGDDDDFTPFLIRVQPEGTLGLVPDVTLQLGETTRISVDDLATDLFVKDEGLVQVRTDPSNPRQFLVTARAEGITRVTFVFKSKPSKIVTVEVLPQSR